VRHAFNSWYCKRVRHAEHALRQLIISELLRYFQRWILAELGLELRSGSGEVVPDLHQIEVVTLPLGKSNSNLEVFILILSSICIFPPSRNSHHVL
jgi:hypothetical protein